MKKWSFIVIGMLGVSFCSVAILKWQREPANSIESVLTVAKSNTSFPVVAQTQCPLSSKPPVQPLVGVIHGRTVNPANRARLARQAQERQWDNSRRNWQAYMARHSPRGGMTNEPVETGTGDEVVDVAADVKPPPPPEMKDIEAVVKFWRETGDKEKALAQLKRLASHDPTVMKAVVDLAGRDDRDLKLFAAAGLAALGTVESAGKLAELIVRTPPGDLKTDLVEVTAGLSNRESAPFLFEIIRVSGDDDLLQAAQRSLANMTDQSLFSDVISRYTQSQDENEKDNLLGSIRHIADTNAVVYMGGMVAEPDTDYADPLALAVIDTLGIIGTPQAVDTLVKLIDRTPPGQSTQELADAIGRVTNPDSLSLLSAIARGVRSDSLPARLAAVQALSHYNAADVVPILKSVVQGEQNADLKTVAETALEKFGSGTK